MTHETTEAGAPPHPIGSCPPRRRTSPRRRLPILAALSAFLVLLLALATPGTLLHAGEAPTAVTAIAALTDPAKLATLKTERSANTRLHKILAWLEEARRAGVVPSKTMDEAQKSTGDTPAHAAVVKEMVLENFRFCQSFSVLTDDNLARMKQGHAPLVTGGTYKGQAFEVDHIVPVAEFPALGNELANLMYLPRTLNRRKSDNITQRTLDHAQKFVAAGVMTPADYARLRATRR